MSRIDPIRRAAQLRRAVRPEAHDAEDKVEAPPSNLPVPVGAARTVPPRARTESGEAVFAAQLMGQDGEKRGLRAGPLVIDTAKHSYNRVEWSGAKDRRARLGRTAKTDV